MMHNASQEPQNKKHTADRTDIIPRYLAIVVLFTMFSMSTFELLKVAVHVCINTLEALLLTILFSTVISGGATYIALPRYNKLNQRLSNEIETRKRLEHELIVAATIDKLTQKYNRRKLEEIIQSEIERAKRYNSPLSLIMLDLDYFKHINDTYGHQIGDRVLRSVADSLKNNIRKSDAAGRWGGEGFMIVVPETTSDNARDLAEKIRHLITASPFEQICTITISLGLAPLLLGDSFDSFIKRVDDGLYQAKHRGKNRVEAFY